MAKHLCMRVQRGFVFAEQEGMWGEDLDNVKTLVVSGGVASNQMIRRCLEKVGSDFDVRIVCPPPKYCTDNGVMIAWNGLEKYRRWEGDRAAHSHYLIPPDRVIQDISIAPRVPLGEDISNRVSESRIKCKWVKII
jgi:N6-L-threonylcarbamoyladenine synthase